VVGLLVEQRERWRRGERVPVESYLERFPSLAGNAEAVLDLIGNEQLLRQEAGETPQLADYLRRFPRWAPQIHVQFEVERALDMETLSQSAAASAGRPGPAAAGPPAPVPGYELLEELGRGGQSVVHKARQVSLNRLVALKQILTGAYAGAAERARFRTEAEAIARLQHPNVVQIYEVGERDGVPFLCLEFVGGGSLAQRLAAGPLPPREAARLVEAVGRAMHAVHQHGIVHRDLKPQNVLLTADGVPKVTDFGLAKCLREGAAGNTQSGDVLGTPAYMAPEQAAGKNRAVGPAADVYALGAVLYECLTGRPPFRAPTALETLQQVLAEDPVPPSRLQPKLPRDLETVCRKCLEKEPRKRYGTAQDLADDLGRFLAGEPVRARPAPPWERGLKWARRRPALAALLLVSTLAAVGLALGGLWHNARLGAALGRAEEEREQARANYRLARQAVETMLTRVSQKRLAYVPQMEHARRGILKDALAFYLRFLADNRDDPEARQDAAWAYGRVGTINQLLDRHAEAEEAFASAVGLLRQLEAEFPAEPKYRHALADQHNNLALLYQATGRYAKAESAFGSALEVADRLPSAAGHRQLLASVHNNRAVLREAVGDYAGAEAGYRRALAEYARLHAADPASADYRREMALCQNNLAVLLTATGRLDEAAGPCARALALQEKLTAEAPPQPAYRRDLAATHLTHGSLLAATGRPEQAREAVRRAEQLYRLLVRDFPGVPAYRHELAKTCSNLAGLLAEDGDRGPAREAFAEAVALGRQLRADCPDVPEVTRDLAAALNNWAELRRADGARGEAEQAVREAVALLADLAARFPSLPDFRHALANSKIQLAQVAAGAGRPRDAEQAAGQARDLLARLVADFPKVPAYRGRLAEAWTTLASLHMGAKRPAEAEAALRAAWRQRAELAEAFPSSAARRRDLARAHVNLARLLEARGDRKRAGREVEAAVRIQEQIVKDWPGVAGHRQELARHQYTLANVLGRTAPVYRREALYGRARAEQERLVAEQPKAAAFRWDLAATLHQTARLLLEAGRPPEALCLVERAVREQRAGLGLDDRDPAQRWALRTYHSSHAEALVRLGRHAEVEAVAAKLWQLYPEGHHGYLGAAWFLARCVPLAERDGRLSAARRQELGEGYAGRAVALLRQAVANGYRDAAGLRGNEGFRPLRRRADFQALLHGLEAPARNAVSKQPGP
jgi:tetratricopeptide (TPR) repeat protein/tRNA A-37 threonylcarbamoyl transferase component Bud32